MKPGATKPKAGPGAKAPAKPALPGQPGQQPGDEWGEDNPGNTHGVGVDDHVFFHRDGAGPHAGRVTAHGVHGCRVEDDAGGKHKVKWSRVLGLKKRAVRAGRVVDQGEAGAIVEHEDGRRVFVAGDLGGGDEPAKFGDVASLESHRPKPAKRLSELEPFARGEDLTKSFASDHECEGPALCRICQAVPEAAAPDLSKALAPGIADLASRVARLRSGALSKSLGAGARPLPALLRKP